MFCVFLVSIFSPYKLKTKKEMKKTQVEIRRETKKLVWVDNEKHRLLKIEAAQRGITMNELIGTAVLYYKENN